MCYNACVYFKFNPMEGTDRCMRPNGSPCLDDEPEEVEEEEVEEEDDGII